jgi:hypothetical protein
MRSDRPRRLSYANVVATVALLLASGGTAYAANTVRSADIVDGAVKSVDIRNNTILAADLSAGVRARLDGGVDELDDLEGLACTVGDNPGTTQLLSEPGDPGVTTLTLACVQTPLTCPPPTPSGNHIQSADCDPVTGDWQLTCEAGFADTNGDPDDGCEDEPAVEVCNGLDDDGDFATDEGLGEITVPHGTADCQGAAGYLVNSCDSGFEDQNGLVEDGCEVET